MFLTLNSFLCIITMLLGGPVMTTLSTHHHCSVTIMPMNPRLLRPTASGRFLLDRFGDAAVAYSLRRLSSRYTGPVVQVRRSSDNAEDTFTAEQVASGAMTAWVGAGNNGFVRTWFDQSGRGKHVEQGTSGNQPRIVNSGVIDEMGGKPAVNILSDTFLVHSALAFSDGPISIFAVVSFTTNGAVIDASTNNVFSSSEGFRFDNFTNNYRLGTRKVFTSVGRSPPVARVLRSGFGNASARTIFENGGLMSTTAGNASPEFAGVTNHVIGRFSGLTTTGQMVGLIQDLIVYNTDRQPDNLAIVEEINRHYGVF
jgi:hypothetical protein